MEQIVIDANKREMSIRSFDIAELESIKSKVVRFVPGTKYNLRYNLYLYEATKEECEELGLDYFRELILQLQDDDCFAAAIMTVATMVSKLNKGS